MGGLAYYEQVSDSQPFKLYFDKDYDYINGWRKKNEDDENGEN